MVRKHAQRLKHYIETLEAQTELIRPKTVATAMRWLETLIVGLGDAPALPKQPWEPVKPYIEPYIQPAPTPPWEQPWTPHEPWLPKKDDFYYWDDLVRITSTGNTDKIK